MSNHSVGVHDCGAHYVIDEAFADTRDCSLLADRLADLGWAIVRNPANAGLGHDVGADQAVIDAYLAAHDSTQIADRLAEAGWSVMIRDDKTAIA